VSPLVITRYRLTPLLYSYEFSANNITTFENDEWVVNDIFKELIRTQAFKPVFHSLRQKASSAPYRLLSHPVNCQVTLDWILRNEDSVSRFLIKAIKKQSYHPQPAHRHLVQLDKPRQLFSLAWPDRIVEMTLAKLIDQVVSPNLSSNLHSYRKGLGNLTAVKALADFVSERLENNEKVYLVKRDIKDFGQSVNPELLFQKLSEALGQQSEYFWLLLREFLLPTYNSLQESQPQKLTMGLPDGYALTPVCENLFLNEIDSLFSKKETSEQNKKQTTGSLNDHQSIYLRYGNDILLASNHRDCLLHQLPLLEKELTKLKLHLKADKCVNIVFNKHKSTSSQQDSYFKPAGHIDYLGLSVNCTGKIFISTHKLEKLQINLRRKIRYAFLTQRRLLGSQPAQIQALIKTVNLALEAELAHPALLLMLDTATDQDQIKRLDQWIAKQILGAVFTTRHDRVFRYFSYKQLKEWGLRSLTQKYNQRKQHKHRRSIVQEQIIGTDYND
jgi:hypothetical protein